MTMPPAEARRIAYFSMEIALQADIPTYSGGLGVLSGDTLRSGADLGLPMVAVSLLYRQGFFRQRLSASGQQTEEPYSWDPSRFLTELETRVTVKIEGRDVELSAWLFTVRGVTGATLPVYLLDADLPENEDQDRALTGQLYGGDQEYRLKQEVVLGLGGLAMLRALGYDGFDTFHMNEGHSALLTLGLLRESLGDRLRQADVEDIALVKSRCVFTTHTPVPAGHDIFGRDLLLQVLEEPFVAAIEKLLRLEDGALNMTHLGLLFSRYVNGVARRHREVAASMYPGVRVESITNGVHAQTWVSPPFAELFDEELPGWRSDNNYLREALMVDPQRFTAAHAAAKRDLLAAVRGKTGTRLGPDAFTIGFARRAATYKRADLVFSQPQRLVAMAKAGKLQFLFAGKAHPHDEPGKALIRNVFAAGAGLKRSVPVIYLEDYDLVLGKLLTSGVDLWLNNPEKPLEASGTSGMKASLNGVPSLSVLDGWWPEGWVEGVTGWCIGDGEPQNDVEQDADALYDKLDQTIMPLYYGRPEAYAEVMRATIALNGSFFNTQRMMQQYAANAYRLR